MRTAVKISPLMIKKNIKTLKSEVFKTKISRDIKKKIIFINFLKKISLIIILFS